MKLNFKCLNVDLQDGDPPSEFVSLIALDDFVSGTIELVFTNKEQQGKFENGKVYTLELATPEEPHPVDVTA
jgi:hypothetical protein